MADPTLEKADELLVEQYLSDHSERGYLGMSSIGEPCARKLWYNFRKALPRSYDAKSIKRFIDGHHGEEVMAERLRAVGVELDVGSKNKQHEFSLLGGHFIGHPDGYISGLLQDPYTKYVWEHKQVNEEKYEKLIKLKEKHSEQGALKEWDIIYYSQAVIYMHSANLTKHYLTCSTPGAREVISCVTLANPELAQELIQKAKSIIESEDGPARISNNPSWYQCKAEWCDFRDVCHKKKVPQKNCRTCLHSTAHLDGSWTCTKLGGLEVYDDYMACNGENHLYLPAMLDSMPVDATDEAVIYADGRINYIGGKVE